MTGGRRCGRRSRRESMKARSGLRFTMRSSIWSGLGWSCFIRRGRWWRRCSRGQRLESDAVFVRFDLCEIAAGDFLQVVQALDLAVLFAIRDDGRGLAAQERETTFEIDGFGRVDVDRLHGFGWKSFRKIIERRGVVG